MSAFNRANMITVLHFTPPIMKGCNYKRISEVQACLISPSVLREKVRHFFFASRNASSYCILQCCLEYVNYSVFTYTMEYASFHGVRKLKDLKQVACKTEVEFRARVHKIVYQCGNAFLLQDKISTFVFGQKAVFQTNAAHKTKELGNKGWAFDNVIQIARKEAEAYRTRLTKSTLNLEAIHISPHRDQEETFTMHGKSQNHVYCGQPKRVVPPSKFLYSSVIIDETVRDGLTSPHKMKSRRRFRMSFTSNVTATKTTCRGVDISTNVEKNYCQLQKSSLARAKTSPTKLNADTGICKSSCSKTLRPFCSTNGYRQPENWFCMTAHTCSTLTYWAIWRQQNMKIHLNF